MKHRPTRGCREQGKRGSKHATGKESIGKQSDARNKDAAHQWGSPGRPDASLHPDEQAPERSEPEPQRTHRRPENPPARRPEDEAHQEGSDDPQELARGGFGRDGGNEVHR